LNRSRTWMRLIILGVIFVGISVALYNAFIKDTAAVQANELAPDFILKTLEDNQEFQLSKQQGKGIVLNFWGTWCAPCREEMPALEKMSQEFKDKGVEVIGVNIGESDVTVESFRDTYHITFPILMDRKREITQLYEIGPIPTTYFIDPDGVVKKIVIGGPMAEKTIKENIAQILPQQ